MVFYPKVFFPFWPECLHIKFPQNVHVRLELHTRNSVPKYKDRQCHFYLRQTNSPEFKHVVSGVVQKASCLRRRFSQEVSSSDAILDTMHLSTLLALHCTKISRVFTENGLFCCKISYIIFQSCGPILPCFFPTCAEKHTHHDVIRICKSLHKFGLKTSLSAQFFAYSKKIIM